MAKRFVAIWFRHLLTDWFTRRKPELKEIPFVIASPDHGRMIVKAVNPIAYANGIYTGMVVADGRAILPELQVFDEERGRDRRLLKALAEWCIRFTPITAVDGADGIILDASGCPHLWGGELAYLKDLLTRLRAFGYHVRIAMADTIGAAWAISRYDSAYPIIEPGKHIDALLSLPPAALRLESSIAERLHKLGLKDIRSFIHMPRKALRRRFGESLLQQLDYALGQQIEPLIPVCPIEPYQERLPCLEPIKTATGIEIALKELLEQLCKRLADENMGLRIAVFKCYRLDGNIQAIQINTAKASRNSNHLYRLFELKTGQIEPDLGIELFVLEAPVVEPLISSQEAMWNVSHDKEMQLAELLDRLAVKVGEKAIHRYLPAEHYWPERSYQQASSLEDQPATSWREDLPRPIHLLPQPEQIEVTVAIPDYPPILFKHKNVLHRVAKADGPERIEQEWWIEQGLYRDYYCVEDDNGKRYWLFRAGHYEQAEPKWFLHGYFA